MTISTHPYQTEADLRRIQSAVAGWIEIAGFRGYMNVSDIALRLFMGNRNHDPGEIMRLWEDEDGRVVGCGMVYPAWNTYEVHLHPGYRQHRLAMEILDWAEHETINWMQKAGRDRQAIQLNVFDGDTARITWLEQRGYARCEHRETISIRPLDEPIPQPQLPDGFSIRSVQGELEVGKLIALINDSFGLSWTAEGYQKWMRSPGYRADNEMVVVAPDGRFASSCILLPDTHNRAVMFENVGTGGEFRRMGLAKALLYAGMERMKTQGFTTAMVPHGTEHATHPSNLAFDVDAASALYAAVGFRPTYKIYRYTRDVP